MVGAFGSTTAVRPRSGHSVNGNPASANSSSRGNTTECGRPRRSIDESRWIATDCTTSIGWLWRPKSKSTVSVLVYARSVPVGSLTMSARSTRAARWAQANGVHVLSVQAYVGRRGCPLAPRRRTRTSATVEPRVGHGEKDQAATGNRCSPTRSPEASSGRRSCTCRSPRACRSRATSARIASPGRACARRAAR